MMRYTFMMSRVAEIGQSLCRNPRKYNKFMENVEKMQEDLSDSDVDEQQILEDLNNVAEDGTSGLQDPPVAENKSVKRFRRVQNNLDKKGKQMRKDMTRRKQTGQ